MTVIIRPRMSGSKLFRRWIFLPLYQVVNSIGFPSTDLSAGSPIKSLTLPVSIANRLNLSRPRDQKKRWARGTRKKFDHHMFQTSFAFGLAHVKFAQALLCATFGQELKPQQRRRRATITSLNK